MFRGPFFIVSTMQAGTTPTFNVFGMNWTQQQPGIEPTKPLGQCLFPPFFAFYDQQWLLRAYSSPGSSIRSSKPRPPWVELRSGAPKWVEKAELTDGAPGVERGTARVEYLRNWCPLVELHALYLVCSYSV